MRKRFAIVINVSKAKFGVELSNETQSITHTIAQLVANKYCIFSLSFFIARCFSSLEDSSVGKSYIVIICGASREPDTWSEMLVKMQAAG